MRSVLVLLVLALPCLAQTQGNAPSPADSYLNAAQMNGGGGACSAPGYGCVNFVEGVNSQDLIVCSAGQQTASACGFGSDPPWTFSDTASFTWNMETASNNGLTGGAKYFLQTGYACTTSSQSTYRVNWSANNGGQCDTDFNCVRIPHACSSGSVTVDAFQANFQATSGTGATTITNTLTTTRTLDLVVSAAQKAAGNGGSNSLHPLGTLGITGNSAGQASMAWGIANTLGSNSFSWDDYNSTHNNTQAQTTAFRIPIILGDSALPQAGTGVAYSAQLHCYGAAVSNPTYTLASGSFPSGISLNTSTGAITGTTSTAGSSTLQFTCTDGTNTSPTDTLTLQVSGFGSIQQLATQHLGFNNGGGSFSFPTSGCGDVITVYSYGVDTHGGSGYLQTINGVNNYVKSSDGSPVQQYFLTAGTRQAPLVMWVIGPLASSAPTITVANSTSASSGLDAWASLIRGAQAVLDIPTPNSTLGTANGSISASYTTVVPNEFLQVGTFTIYNSNSFTLSAPFALDTSGNNAFDSYAFGHSLVAGASTVTATTNISNSLSSNCSSFNFCDPWTTLVTAIRPGFDLACSNFAGSGEKPRRPSW